MRAKFDRHLTVIATAVVFVALYATAGFLYDGFFSLNVFVNLLTDNAALGIAAVGLTLVIFTGGIDLSVGAVIGLAIAAAATRLLTTVLFGVQPLDPITFVWVGMTLAGTAVVAIAGPAWRAAQIDPAVALRSK